MIEWMNDLQALVAGLLGAAIAGTGIYWRLVLRIQKMESRVEADEKEMGYVKDKLRDVSERLDRHRDRMADNDSRFTAIETKLDHITTSLDKLVDKLDS